MDAPVQKSLPAQTVVYMDHVGSYDEIGQVYRQLYTWAKENDVGMKGKPFTIFLSPPSEFDAHSARFQVCMPVENAPEDANDAAKVRQLPACTVASITVKGPYSQIPAHYTEMYAWLDAEGWQRSGQPREVYLRGPDAEGKGDPATFITEIQFPI